jgi:hypothetical protein
MVKILALLPDFLIRFIFKILFLLNRKESLKVLSRERNISSLLRVLATKDYFYKDERVFGLIMVRKSSY